MRAVVQRVERASVAVGDEVVGAIGAGLLILVGVGREDLPEDQPAGPGGPHGLGGPDGHGGPGGGGPGGGPGASPGPGNLGDAPALAQKIATLRIFPDESGRSNLSLLDTGGAALVISQFTLYADTRRGRRPSFTDAAQPGPAEALVEEFRAALEDLGVPTATGRFGAHMTVSLVNDGPYTIVLDSKD